MSKAHEAAQTLRAQPPQSYVQNCRWASFCARLLSTLMNLRMLLESGQQPRQALTVLACDESAPCGEYAVPIAAYSSAANSAAAAAATASLRTALSWTAPHHFGQTEKFTVCSACCGLPLQIKPLAVWVEEQTSRELGFRTT